MRHFLPVKWPLQCERAIGLSHRWGLPRRCDALGNVNNVVVVPAPPPGAFLPLPGSELALARRTAAALAFATKMGIGGARA